MVGHSLSDRYHKTFLKRGMKEDLSHIWLGIIRGQIKMPCSHIMYHRYGYKLSGTRSQRLIPVGADFPLPNTCNSSFCGYQNKPLRPHLETKSNTHDIVCDVTYSPFSSSQCLAEMSCAALVSSVIRVQEEKKRMELLVIFFKAGLMCMAIKGQVHPKKKKKMEIQ